MGERLDRGFLLLAWWPVLWHGGGAALAWTLPMPWRWWLLTAWVLLLPPLLCHASDRLWPVRGTHAVASAAARLWGWQQQLQMPFNRLPWFEEALRLVPGLYQLWLRLWGGRVSLACVFAPHVVVTDRQLVIVARGAVLGDGCLLGGHLVTRVDGWKVTVSPVTVEAGAVVGTRAVLGPGVLIAAGEQPPAGQLMPPFSRWHDGRRHKAVANA